jgi:hypothetical protein
MMRDKHWKQFHARLGPEVYTVHTLMRQVPECSSGKMVASRQAFTRAPMAQPNLRGRDNTSDRAHHHCEKV